MRYYTQYEYTLNVEWHTSTVQVFRYVENYIRVQLSICIGAALFCASLLLFTNSVQICSLCSYAYWTLFSSHFLHVFLARISASNRLASQSNYNRQLKSMVKPISFLYPPIPVELIVFFFTQQMIGLREELPWIHNNRKLHTHTHKCIFTPNSADRIKKRQM